MANTAVDDLFNRWSKRSPTLSSLDQDKYKGVLQQDIQSVLKGGAPLSDQEAALHIAKNVTGQSLVGDPKRKTGFWGTIGNIPSDLKDIASSLPKLPGALIKEGTQTADFLSRGGGSSFLLNSQLAKLNPRFSEQSRNDSLARAMGYENAADMAANDPELQGDVSTGDIFRLLTKSPVIRMTPGAYAAGNLTSPEGRVRLQEAPVQAGLDVLPIAGKLGRTAAAAKVSDPALARTIRGGGRPARAAAVEAFGEGTPMEALASGRPIRALSRVTPTGRTRLGDKITLSDRLKGVAEFAGVSSEMRDISRQASIRNRAAQEATDAAAKRYTKELSDLGFKTEDDLVELQRSYLTRRKNPLDDIDPEAIAEYEEMTGKKWQPRTIYRGEGSRTEPSIYGDQAGLFWSTSLDKAKKYLPEKDGKLLAIRISDPWEWDKIVGGKSEASMADDHILVPREVVGRAVPVEQLGEIPKPVPDNYRKAFKLFDEEMNRLVDDPDSALYRDPSGEVRSRLNPAEKDILALTKKQEMLQERVAKHAASLEIPFGSAADLTKYPETRTTKKGNVSKRRKGEPMQEYLMRTSERARDRTAGLLEKAEQQLVDLATGADDVLAKRPPARFMPILADRIRESLKQWAYAHLEPDAANKVIQDIDNKLDPLHGEFLLDDEGNALINSADDAIPKKEINKIIKEHYGQWTTLKEEGLDPGYLPGVTRNREAALSSPSIMVDRDYAATYERGRNALGAATTDNALTSLIAGAAEQARKAETRQFINWLHKENVLVPGEELLGKIRQDTRVFAENNLGNSRSARAFEETLLRDGYEKFDPKGFGLTYATPGGDFYIPKAYARTLRQLGYRDPSNLVKANNLVQGTFKRAVLFQPSFLFNNAVGNMMVAMMEADSPVSFAQDAYKAFKDTWGERKGRITPGELRQGVASVDMTPSQQFQFSTGGKLRQFLDQNSGVQRAKWIESKWFGANARLDDFWRSWAYIQEFRKTGDVDKAVQYARQVFSDMDELTPLERNVIKQVIPFYSFQRHLFKFAGRYPVDHPIRTQVIAAAIRQQEEEGDLPGRFKTMFWLGEPDENGEQWRVNLRSLNPFNDFGNNLTLGGFLQNSTPLIKAPVEALGISDITGAPGYTKRGYNPESGRYESGRDFSPRKFVGNFLPFVEKGMDEFDIQTGESDGRYVPSREPTWLRGVTSVANIPLVPRVTNVDRERYMQEKARVRDVTNAVQDVQAGRSDAQLRRYQGLVPFRGQLVPAPLLAKFLADYEAALREAGYTGAPSAVTPRR